MTFIKNNIKNTIIQFISFHLSTLDTFHFCIKPYKVIELANRDWVKLYFTQSRDFTKSIFVKTRKKYFIMGIIRLFILRIFQAAVSQYKFYQMVICQII
jgi:hypothetical protein